MGEISGRRIDLGCVCGFGGLSREGGRVGVGSGDGGVPFCGDCRVWWSNNEVVQI